MQTSFFFFLVHRHFQLFQILRALNQIFEQSKHILLTWSNAHIHPQRFTLHVRLHVRCVSVRQRRPTVSTAASATGRPPADRERKGDTHQKLHPKSCTVNAAAASQAGEVGRTRAGRIQMRTCETGYKCLEWITEQLPVRERDRDMAGGGWRCLFLDLGLKCKTSWTAGEQQRTHSHPSPRAPYRMGLDSRRDFKGVSPSATALWGQHKLLSLSRLSVNKHTADVRPPYRQKNVAALCLDDF